MCPTEFPHSVAILGGDPAEMWTSCSGPKPRSTSKKAITSSKIWPNPTNGIINFAGEVSNVNIIDNLGRVIMTQVASSNNIDLLNTPKGVYFIKYIKSNGEKVTERIVKI